MSSSYEVLQEAFKAFMDFRSAIAMYMFILEESIQTANMGNWIMFKAGLYDKMKENGEWIKTNLAYPLKSFCESAVGAMAFPLNESYKLFAEATLKSLEAQETAISELKKQST